MPFRDDHVINATRRTPHALEARMSLSVLDSSQANIVMDKGDNTCIRQAQLEGSTTGPILKARESGTHPVFNWTKPAVLPAGSTVGPTWKLRMDCFTDALNKAMDAILTNS